MPKQTGSRITFDQTDWLSTLSPQYDSSPSGTPIPIGSNDLFNTRAFNPYILMGNARPGQNKKDVTNVSEVTDLLLNGVLAFETTTPYCYAVGQNALFHQISLGTTPEVSAAGVWPHTITGTGAVTGSDVVIYNAKVGGTSQPCIFYSWNDSNGTWNVGRYLLDGTNFDDDFMTTVPATPITTSGGTKPHSMYVGEDNILYIADGNKLHSYDGQTGNDGTCSTAVVTLPTGSIITSFARFKPRNLVIYAYLDPRPTPTTVITLENSESKAYVWDYLELDPSFIYTLNDNIVSAGFTFKGMPGCFTQGRQSVIDGELRFSRLVLYNPGIDEFEEVASFIGNAPTMGGVDIIGDTIQWNTGGDILCYGSPHKGLPVGLNYIAELTGTSNGMLKTMSRLIQLGSSGATTSGGLQYLSSTEYAAAANVTTAAFQPIFEKGKIGKVNRVRVTFAGTATGGRSLNMYLQSNDDLAQLNNGLTEVSDGALTIEFHNVLNQVDFSFFFTELRFIATWASGSGATSCPIIQKVDVFYEEKNLENS